MTEWTDYKIRGVCNKLIAALKAAGIRATRQDISTKGQVIVKLGYSFVAGLDFFEPDEIICTAGGVRQTFRTVDALAADLVARLKRNPELPRHAVRLEKRNQPPF